MRDAQIQYAQTFRSIYITNANGDKFNITPNVQELNIFEDIFSNTMSGNVLVADDRALGDKMGLTGNERITIELSKDKTDNVVEILDFYVYSTNNRDKINPTAEGFMMHFCSLENVLNEHTRAYHAITGQNSEAVKSLFKMIGSTKTLDVEETTGSYKFVMPSWTPFEGINWYAGRSLSSESGGSYFLAYESLKGFKFKCVETLIKQTPVYEYFYEPAGLSGIIKDASNIRQYEVVELGDSIKGVSEQFTTLWTHDLIRKKATKNRFAVDENNKGILNDVLTGVVGRNGFGIDLTERREQFGTNVIFKGETRNVHSQTESYYYRTIQPKLSAMRQFSNTKVRFYAFGTRDIGVGDVITMNFLRSQLITEQNKDKSEDKSLSGKYLVTAIRYIFKPQEFNIVVEAVKDSRKA